MSVDLIRKYARKARDYEQTYKNGRKAGKKVEEAYKSHRRVLNENNFCVYELQIATTLNQVIVL